MSRQSGFYRVKDEGEWTIAQYQSQGDRWFIIGEGGSLDDDWFDEIDEARIEMPGDRLEAEPLDSEPPFK